MSAACSLAYRNERERLVNERILGMYGMTLAQWIVKAAHFGDVEVARINRAIENFDVGVELIVLGYDSRNVPHVFTVVEPGTSENRDHEAFVVIGSGARRAQDSLLSRELPMPSQAELMCRVLEAKFCAEGDYVGPDSCAGVIVQPKSERADAPERFLRNREIDAVRTAVQSQRTNPYPDDVIEAVQKGIDSAVTSAEMERAVQHLMKEAAARKNKQG